MSKYLIAYAVVAVITFGHSYNSSYEKKEDDSGIKSIIVASLSAGYWPLYWSVRAWEPVLAKEPR